MHGSHRPVYFKRLRLACGEHATRQANAIDHRPRRKAFNGTMTCFAIHRWGWRTRSSRRSKLTHDSMSTVALPLRSAATLSTVTARLRVPCSSRSLSPLLRPLCCSLHCLVATVRPEADSHGQRWRGNWHLTERIACTVTPPAWAKRVASDAKLRSSGNWRDSSSHATPRSHRPAAARRRSRTCSLADLFARCCASWAPSLIKGRPSDQIGHVIPVRSERSLLRLSHPYPALLSLTSFLTSSSRPLISPTSAQISAIARTTYLLAPACSQGLTLLVRLELQALQLQPAPVRQLVRRDRQQQRLEDGVAVVSVESALLRVVRRSSCASHMRELNGVREGCAGLWAGPGAGTSTARGDGRREDEGRWVG